MYISENDLNNYQCIFPNYDTNIINRKYITHSNLIDLILESIDLLNKFEDSYDKLLLEIPYLKKVINTLGVNYIEIKAFSLILRRQIVLCGYLIQKLNYTIKRNSSLNKFKDKTNNINNDNKNDNENKANNNYINKVNIDVTNDIVSNDNNNMIKNKDVNTKENQDVSLDNYDYINYSKHIEYFDNLIENEYPIDKDKIINNIINKCLFYFNNSEVTKHDELFKNDVKEYINIYADKEIEFRNSFNNDQKPSYRILYFLYTEVNKIITYGIYKINYFLSNKEKITIKYTTPFSKDNCNEADAKSFELNDIDQENTLFELLQIRNKLQLFNNIITYIYNKDTDNIIDEIDHKDKQLIKENYNCYFIKPQRLLQNQFNKLNEMLIINTASLEKSVDTEKDSIALMKHGIYMAYYFMNMKKALNHHNKFKIKYDMAIGKHIWGLVDLNVVKNFSKLNFPNIRYRNRYYIDVKEGFTLEELDNLLENYLKDINSSSTKNNNEVSLNGIDYLSNKKKLKQVISLKFLANKKGCNNIPIKYFKETGNQPEFKTNLTINTNQKVLNNDNENTTNENYEVINSISIKNTSDKNLNKKKNPIVTKDTYLLSYNVMLSNNTNKLSKEYHNSILIHIHGGGFVAMNSTSHENYLRKFANSAEIPVISIDYSLSPEAQFPKALNEVYQAYLWIVYESGIKADNIILAGDSAGGNLSLSLCYLLILTKKRKPDSLLLIYPALFLSLKYMSPSMLISLDDVVLAYGFLTYCLDSYLGNVDGYTNMFASPGIMHDDILKQLPPINFYIGSTDPLRDQTMVFLGRLL